MMGAPCNTLFMRCLEYLADSEIYTFCMLETINILLTMFNMCNVHLLAVNKVQIQIIIEETESGSEISSPPSLDKVIFETTKHRSANQRYQVMSYRFRLLNRA